MSEEDRMERALYDPRVAQQIHHLQELVRLLTDRVQRLEGEAAHRGWEINW